MVYSVRILLAFAASRCAPMIVGFVFIGVSGASVVVMCDVRDVVSGF